jgi:sphingomyelin phosphodiesterase
LLCITQIRPATNATKGLEVKSPAGPNGDHNCDVPFTLETSMYKAIKEMFPNAAFALFTGDIVDHGMHNTSQQYNEDVGELVVFCCSMSESKVNHGN